MSVRTDLALEARELYMETAGSEVPGVNIETENGDEIKITRVKILDSRGEEAIGKKTGNYITLEIPGLKEKNPELCEKSAMALAKELKSLIKNSEKTTTLVVGLGNSKITPDSLGPRTVSSLIVTRHLFSHVPGFETEGLASVCAIAPGVLGITGIETGEVIKGVAERVKPDVIIAVDALASRSMDRISTTIQIADTGISPGSGVGNKRQALDENLLGIPVVAVGVPMVIDAATVANDTIDKVIDALNGRKEENTGVYKVMSSIDKEAKKGLIDSIVPEQTGGLMVTPKDIDYIVESVSKIVAGGINLCLQKDMTFEEITAITS